MIGEMKRERSITGFLYLVGPRRMWHVSLVEKFVALFTQNCNIYRNIIKKSLVVMFVCGRYYISMEDKEQFQMRLAKDVIILGIQQY